MKDESLPPDANLASNLRGLIKNRLIKSLLLYFYVAKVLHCVFRVRLISNNFKRLQITFCKWLIDSDKKIFRSFDDIPTESAGNPRQRCGNRNSLTRRGVLASSSDANAKGALVCDEENFSSPEECASAPLDLSPQRSAKRKWSFLGYAHYARIPRGWQLTLTDNMRCVGRVCTIYRGIFI